ncbi:MAG: hypothetical protein ACI9SC_002681 [Gammaproteobacteria bacterium]|jgi:hypothetical protein
MPVLIGRQTVPDRAMGCWHRRYIRFEDGSEDTSTRVIWLQTPSGMCDMRISAGRPDFSQHLQFSDCSDDELVALAKQDCSCGITILDEAATPYPTARWEDGDSGFMHQTVINFPEDGWFEWKEEGACMMEYAPSGAYEEDWRLQDNSRNIAAHLLRRNSETTTNLYVAGAYAIMAVDRSILINEERPLHEIIAEKLCDRDSVYAYLNTEFSYANADDSNEYKIALSNVPWREGQKLSLGWLMDMDEDAQVITDDAGHKWDVISYWSG